MPKNDLIFKRLKQATNKEREVICEILGLASKYHNDIAEISKEFRSTSGHTIANAFRDSHGLEYIEILKDTYFGIETRVNKELKKNYSKKAFNKDKASEYELENEIEKLINEIIKNICTIDPINFSEKLKKKIIACGKAVTRTEAISIGLVTKLISLPVSIGVGTAQVLTTPTYRKTYQVTLKLIDIKRRIRAEEKLKD